MSHEIRQVRNEDGTFGARATHYECKSCTLLRICGKVCHEAGCPEAWRDVLGKCFECGCEFERESGSDAYCSPCCSAASIGVKIECDAHASSAGSECYDADGDGCCDSCGVSVWNATCERCGGVGYHEWTCPEVQS